MKTVLSSIFTVVFGRYESLNVRLHRCALSLVTPKRKPKHFENASNVMHFYHYVHRGGSVVAFAKSC